MQFDIDEFNDLYAKTKPTLYIKMSDIFSIHHLVANDISYISPSHDDMLRNVVRELGSVKTNESELVNIGASEICLTLNPKLHNAEGIFSLLSIILDFSISISLPIPRNADYLNQIPTPSSNPSSWKQSAASSTSSAYNPAPT